MENLFGKGRFLQVSARLIVLSQALVRLKCFSDRGDADFVPRRQIVVRIQLRKRRIFSVHKQHLTIVAIGTFVHVDLHVSMTLINTILSVFIHCY